MSKEGGLALASALLGGVTGLKVFSTLAAGYQQAKGLKAQALAAQIEAEMARIRGQQIAETSRRQLGETFAMINAVRSSRGASLDSATAVALEGKTEKDIWRDQIVMMLTETQRAAAASGQARGYNAASRWAIPLASAQAAIGVGETVAKLGAGGGG